MGKLPYYLFNIVLAGAVLGGFVYDISFWRGYVWGLSFIGVIVLTLECLFPIEEVIRKPVVARPIELTYDSLMIATFVVCNEPILALCWIHILFVNDYILRRGADLVQNSQSTD